MKHKKDLVERGIEIRNHLRPHENWDDNEDELETRYIMAHFDDNEKAINWLNKNDIAKNEIVSFNDADILLYTDKKIVTKTEEELKEEKEEFWWVVIICSGMFVISMIILAYLIWRKQYG